MKRFCAAILTLSLLAAALSGCGAAQSAPETTAAQTTFPTETAAPETTVPETQPTVTVDAVPVPQYSQYEAPQPGVAEPVITGSQAYSLGIGSCWLKEKQAGKLWKAFVVFNVFLISAATMFVKQHSAIDVACALPLGLLAEILVFGKYWKAKFSGKPETV
jgi:hypothetical protein